MTEPTVDRMERELQAWGAFRAGGNSGSGYPMTSVLHPSWSPPSGAVTARLPVAGRSDLAERMLDMRIQELSVKLKDAVFLVYVKRATAAQAAQVLGCQPDTVGKRISVAKRLLSTSVAVLRIPATA